MKRLGIMVLTVFLLLVSSMGVAFAGPHHVRQTDSGREQSVGDDCTVSGTSEANGGLDTAQAAVNGAAPTTTIEDDCA